MRPRRWRPRRIASVPGTTKPRAWRGFARSIAPSQRDRIGQRGDATTARPVILVARQLRPAEDVLLVEQVLDAQRQLAVAFQIVVHAQVEQGVSMGALAVAEGGTVIGSRIVTRHMPTEQRRGTERGVAMRRIVPGDGVGQLVRIDVEHAQRLLQRAGAVVAGRVRRPERRLSRDVRIDRGRFPVRVEAPLTGELGTLDTYGRTREDEVAGVGIDRQRRTERGLRDVVGSPEGAVVATPVEAELVVLVNDRVEVADPADRLARHADIAQRDTDVRQREAFTVRSEY